MGSLQLVAGDRTRLGQTIRQLRRQRRLSQAELALLCNVMGKTVVSKWERGVNAPSFGNLKRLATALRVSTDVFFDAID